MVISGAKTAINGAKRSSTMKILIVAADKGGHFAPFVEEQIQALQDLSHEVVRYAVRGKGVRGYLREIPRLRQTICTERPDIIHAHYGLCGLLANLATIHAKLSTLHSKLHSTLNAQRSTSLNCTQHSTLNAQLHSTLNAQRSTKVITTYHGSDINTPRVLRLSRWAMRLSAWNIFVSRANIRTARAEGKWFALWAYRGDNYSLLPCGVTLSEEQLLSRSEARRRLAEMGLQCTVSDGKERKVYSFSEIQNRRLILFAGAFDNSVKDAALAEEVIACLPKRNSDSSFPLRDGACACSESPLFEGEMGSLIELRGFSRSTVNRLMCAADCLLLTSRQEGSPQVIKEAMACGCPIVSVDVGDVRERIERITGCAVANSRDPHELAMLLRMVLNFTPPPPYIRSSKVLPRSSVPKHGSVCCRRGLPIRKWHARCKPSIRHSSRIKFRFPFYLVPCSLGSSRVVVL